MKRTRARIGLLVCFLAAALWACGEPPPPPEGPNVTRVDPTTVEGTVWGEVLDAVTGAPLEGATVALAVGEARQETTSDADGAFTFTGVPAGGTVGVTLSKEGYTRATVTVFIPAEAGNFPVQGIGAFVGPISLFPTDSTLTVQIVGYDGLPVDGARVRATTSAAFLEGRVPRASHSREATASAGIATLSGMVNLRAAADAGLSVTVLVEPVDRDGDSLYEYLGVSANYAATTLLTAGGRVLLELGPPGGSAPLNVIATNIGSIQRGQPRPGDSVVATNGEIRIAFNQPVRQDALVVDAFLYDGSTPFPVTGRVESGNTVVVTPAMPYDPGREYHLRLEVLAAGTESAGNRRTLRGAYFSAPADAEVRVSRAITVDSNSTGNFDAGDQVELQLSQVIGRGEGLVGMVFPVYFNVDLDASMTIGDAPGELGSDTPIWAYSNETPPAGGFQRSGYTRDYVFTMPPGSYSFTPNTNLPYILNLGGTEPGYVRLTDPTGRPLSTPANSETLTVTFQ